MTTLYMQAKFHCNPSPILFVTVYLTLRISELAQGLIGFSVDTKQISQQTYVVYFSIHIFHFMRSSILKRQLTVSFFLSYSQSQTITHAFQHASQQLPCLHSCWDNGNPCVLMVSAAAKVRQSVIIFVPVMSQWVGFNVPINRSFRRCVFLVNHLHWNSVAETYKVRWLRTHPLWGKYIAFMAHDFSMIYM